jgi:hypothetical protein
MVITMLRFVEAQEQ